MTKDKARDCYLLDPTDYGYAEKQMRGCTEYYNGTAAQRKKIDRRHHFEDGWEKELRLDHDKRKTKVQCLS